MCKYSQFNSVREYMIVHATSLPVSPGYFCARKSNKDVYCPVYQHTIDDLFANLIIYADNHVFALVKAIDMLIDQEVSGISYKEFAKIAYFLIINPSGHNNKSRAEDHVPINVEEDIMNDVVFNIHTFWLTIKPLDIVFI